MTEETGKRAAFRSSTNEKASKNSNQLINSNVHNNDANNIDNNIDNDIDNNIAPDIDDDIDHDIDDNINNNAIDNNAINNNAINNNADQTDPPISSESADLLFDQFQRIRMMIGSDAVEKLHQSTVFAAGLGAVGSFTIEALARAGVGSFILADCDTIKPSNINRQLLAIWPTVGEKKTEAARARLLSINPKIHIEMINELLHAENISAILDRTREKGPFFLIDAIDSLGPKVDLLARAVERQIPLISSMGAALRTDPDLIRFGRLTDVTHCRLSAMLRKRIRRQGINTDEIFCVYSPEKVREEENKKILPSEFSEDDTQLPGRRRNVLGSLPTITGMFGLRLAHETILRLINS